MASKLSLPSVLMVAYIIGQPTSPTSTTAIASPANRTSGQSRPSTISPKIGIMWISPRIMSSTTTTATNASGNSGAEKKET